MPPLTGERCRRAVGHSTEEYLPRCVGGGRLGDDTDFSAGSQPHRPSSVLQQSGRHMTGYGSLPVDYRSLRVRVS